MKYLYSIIVLLIFPLLLSFAQENNTETPEPFTRADNECYEGGTMEGRCNQDNDGDGIVSQFEIDWAWSCGWYMARFNDGVFVRGNVPYWCAVLLPSLSIPSNNNSNNTANMNCLTVAQIKTCLIGNYLSIDILQILGSPDFEFYGFADTTVGLGLGTVCPGGTVWHGDTTIFVPLDSWLVSQGFSATDDWCS